MQSDDIHLDFVRARQLAYETSGLHLNNIRREVESAEYGACEFRLGGKLCKFRVGKVTPKKMGFFITIWKRDGVGPIMPYDLTDPVDLFVFSACTSQHFGQFVFPKAVLHEKGILSREGIGGKRALRVYPPWVLAPNRQAKKTQGWQVQYFFEIPTTIPVESARIRQLFFSKE
ncbi:MAG: MepB family protein [Chlamydiia bacterium]|nr:MepB family protein [Chlamydiia bacterium]MCP5510026.1 MepB family protein [Chlamydiales bacterium]